MENHSFQRACTGTRILLYLTAPQLLTPYPDHNRPSAAAAYQRIITAFERDHGNNKSNSPSSSTTTPTTTSTTQVQSTWSTEDRARIVQQVQQTEHDHNHNQMSAYCQQKLEQDASTNWDEFYKTHRTNFFKDRHYMEEEFLELKNIKASGASATLLEAGCGVGNSVYPLLETMPSLSIYCCDFSATAVRLGEWKTPKPSTTISDIS